MLTDVRQQDRFPGDISTVDNAADIVRQKTLHLKHPVQNLHSFTILSQMKWKKSEAFSCALIQLSAVTNAEL